MVSKLAAATCKAWKMIIGICIFEEVVLERPTNMTFDNGTPMAADLAGTQYATAIVSSFFSQSRDVRKHTDVHIA